MATGLTEGAAVLVWIGGLGTGGGIPIGARVLENPEFESGQWWLDVCALGQHLPQLYREAEVELLDVDVARAHGLCVSCLGYGTATTPAMAARIDEITDPCAECSGTGRPSLRVTVSGTESSLYAAMESLPHVAVMLPGRLDMCMACGFPPDHVAARHVESIG